jgi:hypothetical protein
MVYGMDESEFLIVWNSVMGLLKEGAEAQLARSREIEVLQGVKGERGILQAIKRRGTTRIGHILCRKCLLKHVTEGKIEGTRRRERRRKQLLDDLKETRRC